MTTVASGLEKITVSNSLLGFPSQFKVRMIYAVMENMVTSMVITMSFLVTDERPIQSNYPPMQTVDHQGNIFMPPPATETVFWESELIQYHIEGI